MLIPTAMLSHKNQLGHSFYEKKSTFQKKMQHRRQSQEFVPRWLENGSN